MKKGMSKIISVVLFILLTLVAIAILWGLIKGLIYNELDGIQERMQTLNIKIESAVVFTDENNVSLTLFRNSGKGDFDGIIFVFRNKTNSEEERIFVFFEEQEKRTFKIHLENLPSASLVEVSIAPLYKVKNKIILGNVLDTYVFSSASFRTGSSSGSGGGTGTGGSSGGGSSGGGTDGGDDGEEITIDPIEGLLSCSDCGDGLTNICDREECYGLGNCYFVSGFIGGTCISCIGTTCEDYNGDATSCQDNVCGLNCFWDGSLCKTQTSIYPECNDARDVSTCETYKSNGYTIVSSCTDLQNIKNNLAGNYYLSKDIDCSDTRNWNNGAGFEPIGSQSNPFKGNFDGGYNKIEGLYIYSSNDCIGFFGSVILENGKSLSNFIIEDSSIFGGNMVGGVVGCLAMKQTFRSTEFRNIAFIGNVSAQSIIGCQYIGGLIGFLGDDQISKGVIKNSYSKGNVTGSNYVGGLIGTHYNALVGIENCGTSANVFGLEYVGGAFGGFGQHLTDTSQFINFVYSSGEVKSSRLPFGIQKGGGFIGTINGYEKPIYKAIWNTESFSSDCGYVSAYNLDNFIWKEYSSCGVVPLWNINGKTTSQMKSSSTYSGWDFTNTWTIEEGVSYPCHKWYYERFGSCPN